MPDRVEPPQVFRFNGYEVDFGAGRVRRSGDSLPIRPKALELLRALLERPGEVVTREELRLKLWGSDTFVEFDDNLNHTVKNLRQALGDASEAPRFIETLPRHGYRFIAPVEALGGTDAEAPARSGSSRRRPVAAALLLVLAAAVYGIVGYVRGFRRPPAERVMVAVLPFDNLSGDDAQDYVSDGLTEELLTELARVNPARLGVIARTSSARYRQTDKGVTEIGRELGVGYLVEGSVRRDGARTRVTVQLIRVADRTHV
jgi:TolB-like protein/DNA-binding winged helix-turn-helix (wHTH) protein